MLNTCRRRRGSSSHHLRAARAYPSDPVRTLPYPLCPIQIAMSTQSLCLAQTVGSFPISCLCPASSTRNQARERRGMRGGWKEERRLRFQSGDLVPIEAASSIIGRRTAWKQHRVMRFEVAPRSAGGAPHGPAPRSEATSPTAGAVSSWS